MRRVPISELFEPSTSPGAIAATLVAELPCAETVEVTLVSPPIVPVPPKRMPTDRRHGEGDADVALAGGRAGRVVHDQLATIDGRGAAICVGVGELVGTRVGLDDGDEAGAGRVIRNQSTKRGVDARRVADRDRRRPNRSCSGRCRSSPPSAETARVAVLLRSNVPPLTVTVPVPNEPVGLPTR